VWVAAAVAVLVAGVAAWWYLSDEPTMEFCTVAGALVLPGRSPQGADPEAAFDAWFAASGPEFAAWFDEDPPLPTRNDYERAAHAQWRWRYADEEWVQVDLAEGSDGQWAVSGVNECGAYHAS
jgi:hypothetical protein